ncbi:class I SAM-dependent methyltransferase [Vibrio sp. S4M6]|uniref:DUF938 domain-containing protein n=1 Tax=Vibrio sinus TaxID=2946865 RepID=UPI002029F02F|nr:DUF938 domain-containing protein [Vibrio sinus]MCL9781944.1 class I SAM-dependent methyltransferase [Vibrio sinus]
MTKQFSPACDRNQTPIFEQLSKHFKTAQQVLEVGSGTGQHAVYFAKRLPHLIWHTTDMPDNHDSINQWIDDAGLDNVTRPINFTVGRDDWPNINADCVFSANTAHIMQPHEAKKMMELVSLNLIEGGTFCQYGPMKVDGEYTSESNHEFDLSLQQRGYGGIRDIEELTLWGKGLELVEQIAMPANNFLLVWKKSKA